MQQLGAGGSAVLKINLSLGFFVGFCLVLFVWGFICFDLICFFVLLLSSSELLLGPVPTSFTFLPKHKANSYR